MKTKNAVEEPEDGYGDLKLECFEAVVTTICLSLIFVVSLGFTSNFWGITG